MNPITTAVRTYQNADRAVRGIRRNSGRNNATLRALVRHRNHQEEAVTTLLQAGQHQLVGLLTAEAQLSERLRAARATGQVRPELLYRLRCTRRDITRLVYQSAAA